MTTTAIPAPRTEQPEESVPQAWLTQLVLNPAHRRVHSDLGNSAALHRRVMSLVPNDLGDSPRAAAGVLFRLDTDRVGAPVLLIQTRVAPDTGRLPDGYAEAHTRDMTPLLTALRPGLSVRYRLLGNCVRRCGRNSTAGAWKQAIPLRDEDAVQWWADRAPAAGLTLHSLLANAGEPLTTYHPLAPAPAETEPAKTRGKKDKTARVPYAATLFEGVATVSEPATLRVALMTGIGRGKSYGCGLLSLAPAPHAG